MRHDYCDLCCSYSVKRGRCINREERGVTTITFAEWLTAHLPRCPLCGGKKAEPQLQGDRHQTWRCAHGFHKEKAE